MTSGTITTDRPSPDARRLGQRGKVKLAAALTAVALATSAYSIRYTDWYQERHFARLPLAALQREARLKQDNPRLLYYAGQRLNEQGRYAEADGYLRTAVGLNPDDPRSRDAWAEALLHTGRITAAFGELTQFARTHDNSALGHLMLGKLYLSQISMQRASEELNRAVALDPTLADGWTALAAAQSANGGLTQAIEAATRAAALRPDDDKNHLGLGVLLLAGGQVERSRRVFAETVALAPNSAAAHREYARCLLTSGSPSDLRQAETEARRALALAPNDLAASFVLGKTLLAADKPADAAPFLQRAAEASPYDAPSAYALMQAFAKSNQPSQASQWASAFRQRNNRANAKQKIVTILERTPNTPSAHRQMARMLAEEGDLDGCIRHAAEALGVAADAPPALVAAANQLTGAGRADKALLVVQRAIEEAPNNPRAREAKGDALLALGRPEEAARNYATASRVLPEIAKTYQRRLDADYARRHSGSHPNPSPAPESGATSLEGNK